MEENKKFKCYFCDREFKSQQSLIAHIKRCPKNPFKSLSHIEKEYTFICSKCGKKFIKNISEYSYELMKFRNKLPMYCSRSCANSHKILDETKEKISIGIKRTNNKYPYFSILVARNIIKSLEEYKKLTHDEIKSFLNISNKKCICKYCNKEFIYIKGESLSQLYCSSECKHKYLSEHTGGYRKGSGLGKSGWYKGIYCDSSWELAFVVYHLDNNLKIKRCKEYRKYIFNNKEHIYIPDFVTDDGIIEIKGYKNEQWLEKEKQNPDVKVLYKDEIQFYINYVIKKYGTDFIKLYDNSGKKDKVSLDDKNISWFYKVNHNSKIYINAFVTNKDDFGYYINNNWNVGRLPIKAFNNYIDARIKINRSFLKHLKGKDKEEYLNSLIDL